MKEADLLQQQQQQQSGLRLFWGIDTINEVTQLVRTSAEQAAEAGMATYDFTTMYTSLTFDTILRNTMVSIQEAQQFEASKSAMTELVTLLTETGWSWDHGWTIAEVGEHCIHM